MRTAALLFSFFLSSQLAIAQTSECKSIQNASDRLACYDKSMPSIALAKPATPKTAATSDKAALADQGQIIDMLAAENSKLDARLKTICRGC